MREIKASEKARGAKRRQSVEAAKRRVADGELYLVRRHNAWFRPEGRGYTVHLADAGVFDAAYARNHLDVEGLSVVRLRSITKELSIKISLAEARLHNLRALQAKAAGDA